MSSSVVQLSGSLVSSFPADLLFPFFFFWKFGICQIGEHQDLCSGKKNKKDRRERKRVKACGNR